MAPFRWNEHNTDHIAQHGVHPEQAEFVIRNARPPFPRSLGNGKYLVWGQDEDGTYLQIIFIYSPPGVIYVIHARPLTEREKRRFRRGRRR